VKLRKVIATALLATIASGAVALHATSSTSTAAPAGPVSAAPREHGTSSSTGERASGTERTSAQADPSTMVDRFAQLTGSLSTASTVTPTAERGAGAYLADGSDRLPGSVDGAVARAGNGGSTVELLRSPVDAATKAGDDSPDLDLSNGIARNDGTTKLMYDGEPYFAVTNDGYLAQESLPAQVGRVYGFNQDAAGNWKVTAPCSGTLVTRDLVITAAHCLKGKDGWVFYPALYGDSTPYGSWASTSATFDAGYLGSSGTQAFDYGFVKLQPNAAGTLPGDVIKPFPVLTDSTQVASMNLVSEGYPVEGWWESQGNCNWNVHCYPWFCESSRAQVYDHGNGFRSIGWGCVANGGISGGPVFGQYNGQWYLVSVHSTGGYMFDQSGNAITTRPAWYMFNSWGPELRQGRYESVVAAAGG
jgi:hypothetical protein